jgi:acyl carrier protein
MGNEIQLRKGKNMKNTKEMKVTAAGYKYVGHYRKGYLQIVLETAFSGCCIYPKDEFGLMDLFAVFGIDAEDGVMLHDIIGKSCKVEFDDEGRPVKLYNLDNEKIVYAVKQEVSVDFEKVKNIIVEVFNVDKDAITMDTDFINDLEADDINMFHLIYGLEEEFDIEIQNEDAKKIVTVWDVVELIKNTLSR